MEKIHETKICFSEKMEEIDKLLAKLRKERECDMQHGGYR